MKCNAHPHEDTRACRWCKDRERNLKYFANLHTKNGLTVYLVRMKDKRTGDDFQKVGITSKTTQSRLATLADQFYIEVLWEIKGLSPERATELETNILFMNNQAGRAFVPRTSFSGSTECFQ